MDRRQFIKTSGIATLGLAGSMAAQLAGAKDERAKKIKWAIKPVKWQSLGPLDLIPQLDQGQKWANESLIKYGTVEPPGGGSNHRCMRAACMPAESAAHYYAMTGDPLSLKAVKAAMATFLKYRHIARARRVPYYSRENPIKLDASVVSNKAPTIEYEMISCHVGRNMRGVRAAAHVLKDEKLLRTAAEELNRWIDDPIAFNRKLHFFDARVFLDENGKTIASERKYTMNMGGSLACAMWLVGNDLGDERLMRYGEDQIINGILPHQRQSGYFPYNTTHNPKLHDGIATGSNHYAALTLKVLSPLLAYKEWREKPGFVKMFRRGSAYLRRLTYSNGMMRLPPDLRARRAARRSSWPKPDSALPSQSALIHARIYKYLGDEEARVQLSKNLRFLHWNSASCIPFMPIDGSKMQHLLHEGSISQGLRQIVLVAWEGIHLKQKGLRDVEAVYVKPA